MTTSGETWNAPLKLREGSAGLRKTRDFLRPLSRQFATDKRLAQSSRHTSAIAMTEKSGFVMSKNDTASTAKETGVYEHA